MDRGYLDDLLYRYEADRPRTSNFFAVGRRWRFLTEPRSTARPEVQKAQMSSDSE